jgi:hypothetical protein
MSKDFLQSMTFASAGEHIRSCDCDECDDFLGSAIAAFVRERKRQRLANAPIKRTQHRDLIERVGSVSLYRLTMPVEAAPLVEFGNSHRIVWIERKPQGTVITSIGKGIIGSSDEEDSRRCLEEWKEGCVILVPSNGGNAVGWLHENSHCSASPNSSHVDSPPEKNRIGNDKSTRGPASPAILYVAKVTPDIYKEIDSKIEDHPLWVKALLECCRQGLEKLNVEVEGSTECQHIEISKRYANPLKQHIRNLSSKNVSTAINNFT